MRPVEIAYYYIDFLLAIFKNRLKINAHYSRKKAITSIMRLCRHDHIEE